ncbi:hypothetical protein [Actinophytocola sp.]|uniref:hypothetical protein n=1 Tax=Actinophytocola sp. TaxID=1872138 RepID=UPI00389AFD12
MTNMWSNGMNGSDIYHNFRGGTGDDARGLVVAGAKVTTVTKRYEVRTKSITQLTTKMESAWQGDAAGAAQRGAGPLAVEHGLAQPNMAIAHKTLTDQVTAFNSAKTQVTEIPPAPEKPGMWDNLTSLGGAGRNYEHKMNQVNTANDHNVAVMEQYETTTSSNTSAMPTTYGRITDDYAAVGVDRPSPPPPSQPFNPAVPSTSTTSGQSTGGTNRGTGSTGNNSTNQGRQNPPGSTQRPPGSTPTTPSNNRPPVGLPPRTTLPTGQNPGQGGGNNPALPGMLPPAGFGPGGGGPGGAPRAGGGFGPRGSGGFGPGGGSGSTGGPGSGRGGFGPGAGNAAAAAEGAAARGAAGSRGTGGMGGMHGGGKRGEGEEDTEHERPTFLVEPDPHDTFGTDEVTAPPVIGE